MCIVRSITKSSIPIILILLSFTTCSFQIEKPALNQTHELTYSSSDGPTIEWDPYWNATIAMDGMYEYGGQTTEFFDCSVWVNDSDGVDTVLFRFSWVGTDYWINRTTVRMEGNETRGKYFGNLTWPAPKTGTFHLKFFANDTLGNWSESPNMTVEFSYIYAYSPEYIFAQELAFGAAVILCISSLLVICYLMQRNKNPS
jgi:hypothetical protein